MYGGGLPGVDAFHHGCGGYSVGGPAGAPIRGYGSVPPPLSGPYGGDFHDGHHPMVGGSAFSGPGGYGGFAPGQMPDAQAALGFHGGAQRGDWQSGYPTMPTAQQGLHQGGFGPPGGSRHAAAAMFPDDPSNWDRYASMYPVAPSNWDRHPTAYSNDMSNWDRGQQGGGCGESVATDFSQDRAPRDFNRGGSGGYGRGGCGRGADDGCRGGRGKGSKGKGGEGGGGKGRGGGASAGGFGGAGGCCGGDGTRGAFSGPGRGGSGFRGGRGRGCGASNSFGAPGRGAAGLPGDGDGASRGEGGEGKGDGGAHGCAKGFKGCGKKGWGGFSKGKGCGPEYSKGGSYAKGSFAKGSFAKGSFKGSFAKGSFKGPWDFTPGWGKGGKDSASAWSSAVVRLFRPELKVWIGNLSESTTWKDLQGHMDAVGKTKWVDVFSGKGKGTGAAVYSSAEEAMQAVATLNGSTLNDAVIVVDEWVMQAASNAGPTDPTAAQPPLAAPEEARAPAEAAPPPPPPAPSPEGSGVPPFTEAAAAEVASL